MLSLMLAAAVHCLDPGYCPGADQLQRAYERWRDQRLAATSEAFASRGEIAMFDPLPILRITGARCGKPARSIGGAPPVIRCTASFHTAIRRDKKTMVLARDESGWVVQSAKP